MHSSVDSIPGLSETGLGAAGVYDLSSDGKRVLNFVKTAQRFDRYFTKQFTRTPLYNYDILKNALNCDVSLKLENLQDFGDISVRLFYTVLLGNQLQRNGFSQTTSSISAETEDTVDPFASTTGAVLVLAEGLPSLRASIAALTVVALTSVKAWSSIPTEKRVTVFVAEGLLSASDLLQLDMCRRAGVAIIFHRAHSPSSTSSIASATTNTTKPAPSVNDMGRDNLDGATRSCLQEATTWAIRENKLLIEASSFPLFQMLGAATVAIEIHDQGRDVQTVVVPYRFYPRGWAVVAGVAVAVKLLASATQVIVATTDNGADKISASASASASASVSSSSSAGAAAVPTSATATATASTMTSAATTRMNMLSVESTADDDANETKRLFPDALWEAWMAKMMPEFDASNLWDMLAVNGVFNQNSVAQLVAKMGGDPIIWKMKQTEFVKTRQELHDEVRHDYIQTYQKLCTGVSKEFLDAVSVDALTKSGFVNDCVTVTERQCATAFIRFLQYAHSVCDGKAAITLAALASGKIRTHPIQKICLLITGGNHDPAAFDELLQYSMSLVGQHFNVHAMILDDIDVINRILKTLNDHQISVVEMIFDRSSPRAPLHGVHLFLQCYGRNIQVQKMAFQQMQTLNIDVEFEHHPVIQNRFDETSPEVASPFDGIPKTTEAILTGTTSTTYESITPDSIEKAYARIKSNLVATPITFNARYSARAGCRVYTMLDNIQNTGSFKIRGASNAVLKRLEETPSPSSLLSSSGSGSGSATTPKQRPAGIIAASAGNHAQGVALVASKVNIPCTIVCPVFAPETKLAFTRRYGAEVRKVGENLEETSKAARELCEKRGWMMVQPFNDWAVIEGQGTIGYEIYQKIPDVETVVIGVGGGGLITGIASYLKKVNPKVRIIGVQPELVSPLSDFKRTGSIKYVSANAATLSDGTNVKIPGGVHTKLLDQLVDEYVTVSENEIGIAIVDLLDRSRTLAEGAGALALAALMNHKFKVRPDEKVCVLVCGGNIDLAVLRQVYDYGLRSMGRAFAVSIDLPDKPGQLKRVTDIAATAHLHLRQVKHARGQADLLWSQMRVELSFVAPSFHAQIDFLNRCVDADIWPEVLGRTGVPDHLAVYAAFDATKVAKRTELAALEAEKERVFKETKGRSYRTANEKQ